MRTAFGCFLLILAVLFASAVGYLVAGTPGGGILALVAVALIIWASLRMQPKP